jgi:hypothetical protein
MSITMPPGVKLLPCPFCQCQKWNITEVEVGVWGDEQKFQAQCDDCAAMVLALTGFGNRTYGLKLLAEQINRRPGQPTPLLDAWGKDQQNKHGGRNIVEDLAAERVKLRKEQHAENKRAFVLAQRHSGS